MTRRDEAEGRHGDLPTRVMHAWWDQLNEHAHLITEGGQIEVRLYANAGKVRKSPTVILNGGPGPMVEPDNT